MELSERAIQIVEGMNMDDDIRQDLYVQWLEKEGTLEGKSDADIRNLASITAWHLQSNKTHVERNRRRLEEENAERIQQTFNMHDYEPDPMNVMDGEQEFERKLKLLSPLLEDTMNYMIDGGTAEEAAKHFGVTENTIYQRMWQAKVILEGE